MWKYVQSTGELINPDGSVEGSGYSGRGNSKNVPGDQCKVDQGPIPRGWYDIGPAQTHPKLGPLAMYLDPDSGNKMCGRSAFYIHGDSASHPGDASDGCIIMNKTIRTTVSGSSDRRLRVVANSGDSLLAAKARRAGARRRS